MSNADRLAELQARKEAREQAAKERQEAAQIEELELEEKIAEAFEKAEEVHGVNRVGVVRLAGAPAFALVKAPARTSFKKFSESDIVKVITQENLVRPCLVDTTWAEFEAICNQYPAFLTVACSKVVELAQGARQDISGK